MRNTDWVVMLCRMSPDKTQIQKNKTQEKGGERNRRANQKHKSGFDAVQNVACQKKHKKKYRKKKGGGNRRVNQKHRLGFDATQNVAVFYNSFAPKLLRNCAWIYAQDTFYSKGTYSIIFFFTHSRLLRNCAWKYAQDTFYSKRTYSIIREHILQ